MSRKVLSPLSREASLRLELLRAKHEKGIRKAMLDWHVEAAKSDHIPVPLTCDRQSHLRDLIIEMYVDLGRAEAREYLAVAASPQQFEIDIHHLIHAVAEEALERWRRLISEFHPKAWCKDGCGKPATSIPLQVRERLKAVVDEAVYDAWDAWGAREERLKAESVNPLLYETTAAATGEVGPARLLLVKPDFQGKRERIARRLDILRRDKGMSVERLAHKAGVDRKTVARILHRRHDAHPETLTSLAGALGVSVSELVG